MADVTSSLIGISINAINSLPAAAVHSLGCSEVGDRAMSRATPHSRVSGSQLTSKWSPPMTTASFCLFTVCLPEQKLEYWAGNGIIEIGRALHDAVKCVGSALQF